MATINLTQSQVSDLEEAVSKPFVSQRWVDQRAAVRTTDADYNAETEAAKTLLAKQTLFRDLCKQHFGYQWEKMNGRPGVCVVTGEAVPENKGFLVKQGGAWKVYSRRGALQSILSNAKVEG